MRHLLFASIVVLAALPLARSANADDRAIASQAFQEGRDLMAAGRVAEACPKFAAAAELSQTAGVRLNLAECYAKLGKTASAWAKADEALALAERAADSAAADLARAQMATLKPTLSYLTIVLAKESALPGTEVTLDGQKILEALWGTEFPVDRGEHEVTAKAPGHRPWSSKATVIEAGARVSVAVPALDVEEPSGAEVHATAQPIMAPSEPTLDRGVSGGAWSRGTAHTLALVSGGLGVVGLAIGAGFGIDASSKKSQYEGQMTDGHCNNQGCATTSTNAMNSANASTVAFVAGGVLAAAGVVLWVTAPGNNSKEGSVAVMPMVNAQGIGAGISGSW
jgi:hypothetical protein